MTDNDTLTSSSSAQEARDKLAKQGRLGWGIVLPFGFRARRRERQAAMPVSTPEQQAAAPPPSKQELFRLLKADSRLAFLNGIPAQPGETVDSYRARLLRFGEEHSDEVSGAVIDALAAGISGRHNGSDRARAAALRLYQAKARAGVDASSLGGPTAFREAKEHGWNVDHLPGGQKRYSSRSLLDDQIKHFTEDEIAAGRLLIRDAEIATRVNLINTRAYDGMPGGAGPAGGKAGHITEDQRRAHARFTFVMCKMPKAAAASASALIVGVRNERMGKPMTAQEFAALASRYTDKQSSIAFTTGWMKLLLVLVGHYQAMFEIEERERRRNAVLARDKTATKQLASQQHPEPLAPLRPSELQPVEV